MNRKLFYTLYAINIISQAFLTLAFPIGLGILGSWLLVEYASFPGWIYAPLVLIGVLLGFSSMIKFVISAMAGIERLEKEQENERKKSNHSNNHGNIGNNNEEK